jgi:hypothetical protein
MLSGALRVEDAARIADGISGGGDADDVCMTPAADGRGRAG